MNDTYPTTAAAHHQDFGNLNNANLAKSSAQPMVPLLPDIGQRVAQIGQMLGEAEAELAALCDRVFGPVPRAVAGSNHGQKEREGGSAQDLIAVLEMLTSLAINVRSEAQRLNGRI